MGIVTVPSGAFTPGALATLQFAAETINASWELANTKAGVLDGKVANVDVYVDTASVPDLATSNIAAATVVEPTVTIPTNTAPSQIYSDFNTQRLALIAELKDKFDGFITQYAPNDSALFSATETWLQNGMSSDSGLTAPVQAQIWGDDQARIVAETSRAKDAVLATFAARRFPLPSGQAASAVLQLEQSAQDKLAESSRKIAVMSVEQFRFLVTTNLTARKTMMDACLEYIKALAIGSDEANKVVGVGYDAQSKMINAASQYYNSRIAVAEQINKVAEFNTSTKLDADTKNQAAEIHAVDTKLKALLAEISALGQMTNALFNNLHANAGTQYSVSA